MSKGTAKQVEMWGRVLRLGDRVRIKYAYGGMGEIAGEVIELWGYETDGHLQARLDSGWCFHEYDKLLAHSNRTGQHRNPEIPSRRNRLLFTCQKCGEEVGEGEEDHNGRHGYCGGELDPIGEIEDD